MRIEAHMCLAPFYLAVELSLLLGPVQNQNLPSREFKYAAHVAHMAHSASLALWKQENTQIRYIFVYGDYESRLYDIDHL